MTTSRKATLTPKRLAEAIARGIRTTYNEEHQAGQIEQLVSACGAR